MPRVAKFVLGIIGLFIVAAIAAPYLVPVDTLKGQVLTRLQAATGRRVGIGSLSFSIFPNVALKATDVSVSNPSWAKGDMADIKTLRIGVALLPLLHKEIHLKELTLEDPTIVLIKRGSQSNWQFAGGKASAAAPAPKAQAAGSGTQDAADEVGALYVGKISIKNGSLTYTDEGSGARQSVQSLDITLTEPSPSSQASLKGSAVYNGKKTSVDVTVADPLGVTTAAGSEASIKASYDALEVAWKGTLALGGTVPTLTGTLDIPTLDARGQSGGSESHARAGGGGAKASGGGHWSNDPIAFNGLASAAADLDVSVDKLVLAHSTLEGIHAHVKLAKGALSVTTDDIKAYGGTAKAAFAVNVTGQASLSAAVDNVQAKDMLRDFAGTDKFSGTLATHLNLTTAGGSERAMVSALGGKGDFAIKDGTFQGANLGAMLHNTALAFDKPESETTAFSILSGTFTIKNGVAQNNDLRLESSSIRASGEGDVNLPGWQVNYLIKPMSVVAAGNGVTVPVRATGDLDHPSYRPDLQAALTENLGNAANLGKALGQGGAQGAGKLLNGGANALGGLLR